MGVRVESFEALAAAGEIAPDWVPVLQPYDELLRQILQQLATETSCGEQVLPARSQLFRALQLPFAQVRVLILGQDPYPTPGHAVGMSFAVDAATRPLPRSLVNIFRELDADLGIAPAPHGDLSAWAEQGVLLLNRVLSVRAGAAGSHRGIGWERLTAQIISALAARGGPLVAVLWGADAQKAIPLLGAVPTVVSAHPSPLSARRGFFGSKPFSRVNELLAVQGAAPITWQLPAVCHQLQLFEL